MMSAQPSSRPHTEGATVGRAFGASGTGRVRRWAIGVLLALLCVMVAVHALMFETFTVPSVSMEPMLRPGDRIVVDKLASVPHRGQVIVFSGTGSLEPRPEPSGIRGVVDSAGRALGFRLDETDFVKRVIGIGGDRVAVGHDGHLRVNGSLVPEAYLPTGMSSSDVPFSITVPRGTVFVLGDNRQHSNDSRDHLGDPGGGFVPDDKIIGTVSWRYWHG